MGEITKHEKPWALTGTKCERKPNIVTSLYIQPEELEKGNLERYAKYDIIQKEEVMYEEHMMDDAEICIVAFGVASRVSKNAIKIAREKGIKVGLIRPITLWPFPKDILNKTADRVKSFISVELSMGQMIEDVELATRCKKPVLLCNRVGGMIPTPDDVLKVIDEAVKIGG